MNRIITVGNRDITVRELTIAEIRAWLNDVTTAKPNQVDLLSETLFDGITFRDLPLFTDLNPAQVESFTPAQLKPVVDAILEENIAWSAYRKKIIELGRKIQREQGISPNDPSLIPTV